MTATAVAPPQKWEAAVESLAKQGASLAEAIGAIEKSHDDLRKKLDEPDFSAIKDYVSEDREAVLKAMGATKTRRGFVAPKGYTPYGEFKSFGEFIRSGLIAKNWDTTEFRNRCKSHMKAIQGMSEAVGSDGGFTVIPEFATEIYDRVYQNDLFTRTDNYTVSGNNMTFMANSETSRANGSRHGGMRAYWIGEGGTITDSNPGFRRLTMSLQKLAIVVYLTDELLSDTSAALEQYVARKASEEFNFMVGDGIINGTGAGQLQGILSSPALVSVAKETGQPAATLVYDNILKMYSRMYAPSRANAVWYINQDIEPQLFAMNQAIGTGGFPVYLPPGGISGAPYATLMGRPVIATEFNATLGTQGDILLADLGQYLTISKGGIAQAQSMHVEFLTDQTALRFIMRVNGQTWENSAITPYKGTATQSSFVALDTRA